MLFVRIFMKIERKMIYMYIAKKTEYGVNVHDTKKRKQMFKLDLNGLITRITEKWTNTKTQ